MHKQECSTAFGHKQCAAGIYIVLTGICLNLVSACTSMPWSQHGPVYDRKTLKAAFAAEQSLQSRKRVMAMLAAVARYEDAISVGEQALATTRRSADLRNEAADIRQQLISFYIASARQAAVDNKITKAEALYAKALPLCPQTDPMCSFEILHDQTTLLLAQGDERGAEALLARAHREWTMRKPDSVDKPSEGQSTHFLLGRYVWLAQAGKGRQRARSLLAKSIALHRRLTAKDHVCASRLAGLQQSQQQYHRQHDTTADPRVPSKRNIARDTDSAPNRRSDNSVSADSAAIDRLSKWARSALAAGQSHLADVLIQRALVLARRHYLEEDFTIARLLELRAGIFAVQDRIDDATLIYARIALALDEILATWLANTAEEDMRVAYQAIQIYVDHALSLHLHYAPNHADAAVLGLDAILRYKGRTLDIAADRASFLRGFAHSPSVGLIALAGNPGHDERSHSSHANHQRQARKLLDKLRQTRAAVAEVAASTDSARLLQQAQTELRAIESQIAFLLSGRRRGTYSSVAMLQRHIPEETTLVEFVQYRPIDLRTQRAGPPHYAAYLLSGSGAPRAVKIGPVADIDRNVYTFVTAIRNRSEEVAALGRQLDKTLFAPIRAAAGEAKQLIIAADGALHILPFAALVDDDGRYLIEHDMSISYVNSGRDLLMAAPTTRIASRPLIIANPDFSHLAAGAGAPVFPPLPGSAYEGKLLRRMIPEARLWSGTSATKRQLMQVRGPILLHIATHGFYGGLAAATERSRGVAVTSSPRPRPTTTPPAPSMPATTNLAPSMTRAGLALAGANRALSRTKQKKTQQGQDGILTALELSSLDLEGTELVVLSACDTGVGEVRAGDGVYGMRRALAVAGAETQVLTLWPISDRVTPQFMKRYYRSILTGAGRAQALRTAQHDLYMQPVTEHPFYWAGFIMSGDPRPLRLFQPSTKPASRRAELTTAKTNSLPFALLMGITHAPDENVTAPLALNNIAEAVAKHGRLRPLQPNDMAHARQALGIPSDGSELAPGCRLAELMNIPYLIRVRNYRLRADSYDFTSYIRTTKTGFGFEVKLHARMFLDLIAVDGCRTVYADEIHAVGRGRALPRRNGPRLLAQGRRMSYSRAAAHDALLSLRTVFAKSMQAYLVRAFEALDASETADRSH